MAWSGHHLLIAAVMIATGTINTMAMKWVDYLKAVGKDNCGPRVFSHPFIQTLCMFAGQLLCLLAFKSFVCYITNCRRTVTRDNDLDQENQDFNPYIFLPPAVLDMGASSFMYIGLNLTNPSSFVMLKGTAVVFTEFLSMTFLKRPFVRHKWYGILMIVIGLVFVGLADFFVAKNEASLGEFSDRNSVITGDLLIVIGQIMTAAQVVYEEIYTKTINAPSLQVVGLEGLFGVLGVSLLLIPLNYLKISPPFANTISGTVEDVPDALVQIMNNKFIAIALIGFMVNNGISSCCGIEVAKAKSATTRMVLASFKTFFVWMISLRIGWQTFHYLQAVGFLFLILGGIIFNNAMPSLRCGLHNTERQSETEPLCC